MFYSKYIIYMNVSLISSYHKLRSSLFFSIQLAYIRF